MKSKFTTPILVLLLLSSCDHKTKTEITLQNDTYVDSVYICQLNQNLQTQKKIFDSINIINNKIVNLHQTNRNLKDKNQVYQQSFFLQQDEKRLNNQLQNLRVQSQTYGKHFPIEDIKKCLNDTLERKLFTNKHNCLICSRKSGNLLWIHFKSPYYTWKNLMGREGSLSICEKCRIPVEFITEREN